MDDLQAFIKPEFLVMAPVLNLIGTFLKRSSKVQDETIPLTLGCIGIVLSVLYVFSSTPVYGVAGALQALLTAFTQGVLCAGAAVYSHQVYKQGRSLSGKDDPQDNPPQT